MASLKSKLQSKSLTIGSWLSLGSAAVCEMMAKSGFDWLVVDLEHAPTNPETMLNMIRVIDLCGCTPLVRVGANDPLLIKHALDAGAHGVIIPQVKTAEEARAAVAASYYPPRGDRGVGLFRAQGYGGSFAAYQQRAAAETVVIVQIEHRDAVADLEEILAVDGVDGFMVGPYDLSGSYGKPGVFDAPEVRAGMDDVKAHMAASQKPGGIHVVHADHEQLAARITEGYTFIAYGVDMIFLNDKITAEGAHVLATVKKP